MTTSISPAHFQCMVACFGFHSLFLANIINIYIRICHSFFSLRPTQPQTNINHYVYFMGLRVFQLRYCSCPFRFFAFYALNPSSSTSFCKTGPWCSCITYNWSLHTTRPNYTIKSNNPIGFYYWVPVPACFQYILWGSIS